MVVEGGSGEGEGAPAAASTTHVSRLQIEATRAAEAIKVCGVDSTPAAANDDAPAEPVDSRKRPRPEDDSSSSDEDVYPVERIISRLKTENNEIEYLVKWEGYGSDDATW